MARKTARPGRTLVVFFLGIAIAYGLVAIGGTWKPELGLDLQGGTRITLIAEGSPSTESMNEARKIIDQRVNGSGVSEAEVTTQGNRFIIVEIPGDSRRDLIDTVERQAQLRFRLVACTSVDGRCAVSNGLPETGLPTAVPSVEVSGQPSDAPSSSPSANPTRKPSASASSSGNNRPPVSFGRVPAAEIAPSTSPSASPSTSASANPSASASPSTKPSASGAPSGSASSDPSSSASPGADPEQAALDACTTAAAKDPNNAKPLDWRSSPTTECVTAFNTFQCPAPGADNAPMMADASETPLITCDENGVAYLLSAAMLEGTQLSDAGWQIPQGQVAPVVTLSFDGAGTKTFADISNALVGTEEQFAIVLDGTVLSAPTMDGRILDGNAQISGDFSQSEAESLATSLKFGSLPIAFEDDPSSETIGPSLAGDQLSAGLTAGAIGLALVMIYCLLYYRGLGLVVLSSLLVAAAITYAMVLLLGTSAGFTLTLPGIAGLIIAVGITADSFIIFFERIRDEMRDGKSMRVAVESGWVRAKVTRLAANVVSLLSATVLYVFATGVVKGFGFALGLSTLIDLAVLFWFTKPMVSWLARFRFFNSGHRLSGLSPETLGMDRAPAGGKA